MSYEEKVALNQMLDMRAYEQAQADLARALRAKRQAALKVVWATYRKQK